MKLDQTMVNELRRPFPASSVLVRPLGNPADDGKAQAAFYIDSRLVVARLNAICGPENWTNEFRLLGNAETLNSLFFPVECRLSLFGVARSDVGQGASQVLDEKAWKSAYSDALKRAAVQFGVGAYLYSIPRLRAEVYLNKKGKVAGFSKAGQKELMAAYERWIANKKLNTFGEVLDHGEVEHPETDEDTTERRGGTAPAAGGAPAARTPDPGPAAEYKSTGGELNAEPSFTKAQAEMVVKLEKQLQELSGKTKAAAIVKAAREQAGITGIPTVSQASLVLDTLREAVQAAEWKAEFGESDERPLSSAASEVGGGDGAKQAATTARSPRHSTFEPPASVQAQLGEAS